MNLLNDRRYIEMGNGQKLVNDWLLTLRVVDRDAVETYLEAAHRELFEREREGLSLS